MKLKGRQIYRLYSDGKFKANYASIAGASYWGKTFERLFGHSWEVNDKEGRVYAKSEIPAVREGSI